MTLGHKTTDEQLSCVPAAPSVGGSAVGCYVNLLSPIWSEIAFNDDFFISKFVLLFQFPVQKGHCSTHEGNLHRYLCGLLHLTRNKEPVNGADSELDPRGQRAGQVKCQAFIS